MTKTDCYYYYEVIMMGAHIPQCRLSGFLGDCPCNTNNNYVCGKYITKSDVAKIVAEYEANQRNKENNNE